MLQALSDSVDDVPLEAKNAHMRAALAVYREIAAELNAESALVVSNCGSALIKFCHRIAAASPVPMCIYMQLPCLAGFSCIHTSRSTS